MDHDAVDAHAGAVHRRDLARALRFGLAIAVVIALVLVGLDNRTKVRVGYVFGDAQAPVWVVIVASALAGMVVAALIRRNRH
ncbi:MAG: LapA family protein [Actinobacteria bacterium]|nr:LapA family protein [Actinomycetota bacterium]